MTAGDHGRAEVLDALRRELVGPEPLGQPLDLSSPLSFKEWAEANGPWHDAATGEEILMRDGPSKRYGVGVLYPPENDVVDVAVEPDDGEPEELPAVDDVDIVKPANFGKDLKLGGGQPDDDDFDLTAANQYRPSAMAVSFLVRLDSGDRLVANAECGRYDPLRVKVADKELTWWVRRPVSIASEWTSEALHAPSTPHTAQPSDTTTSGLKKLKVGFEVFARPRGDGSVLVTVVLRNRSDTGNTQDSSLFQTGFTVEVEGSGKILPYPNQRSARLLQRDEEEQSIQLLYRKSPTFGVGHGCAATWNSSWGDQALSSVSADPLPTTETPSITPDIRLSDNSVLAVSMADLGGLSGEDGFASCERVISEYANWIDLREAEVSTLPAQDEPAATRHIADCRSMFERMREGLEWLRSDAVAREAFELANRAILDQQLRSSLKVRPTSITKNRGLVVADPHPNPDWRTDSRRGRWRPFQIGFLLAAVRSSVLEADTHRSSVDLIFFPTGGGKTEAYLGLAAFAMFYQRLTDDEHPGVNVLMRYTLRLLTAQQFLRASSLICAMERIRLDHAGLANAQPFSIGIWVGQSATPNKRQDARAKLRELNRSPSSSNPFLLLQCPWCAAAMGPASQGGQVNREGNAPKAVRTAGYVEREGTVRLSCPDRRCPFSAELLPVFVVDEDVYDRTPSLVIGTVDKFAQLAWNPQARRLFGLNPSGERGWAPPNLIIQDELHLISGPLGSMAGLYETLIEELSTDHRTDPAKRPKIVCSTATIRQYRRQIQDLYGRPDAVLFPPFGLDASDSFFARYARDEDGSLSQGRMYVGVYAPGLGSMQTSQVRTFSALLQAAKEVPDSEKDPWWTLMCFFNSLRELGTSVSLLQSDIPDYLKAMRNRRGTAKQDLRYLNVFKELTGRLREDEVPAAIQELERTYDDKWPVDVCLASSMIEVGIDITRLSLMCVVGQPKTTSQYIQVTGRVGRNWQERPGLIVTIYGATKPRDRSHFERFQTYHSNLYAQVEPVSVTPFAPPVVKRAAHAILAGYARQFGADNLKPWPVPTALTDRARQLIYDRAAAIDIEEAESLKESVEQRLYEWQAWERLDWDAKWTSGVDPAPLLRAPGRWYPENVERVSWATPTSLRDVDAECEARITMLYSDPPNPQP